MPCALRRDAGRVAASTRTRHLVAGPRRAGTVLGGVSHRGLCRVPCIRRRRAHGRGDRRRAAAPPRRDPGRDERRRPTGRRPRRRRRIRRRGRLGAGPLALDVVRWWSPRPPRIITSPAYDARLHAVSRLTADTADRARTKAWLPGGIADGIAGRIRQLGPGCRHDALLGLGEGLTPQGDDVLAGLLVTLHAATATRPMACRLGDVVAGQAATRTTTLSAALLRDAADGFAVPALVDLVDALHETGRAVPTGRPTTHRTLADAVVPLLAVGHTSGAALAHGVLAAARLHATMHVRGEGVLT